MEKPKRARRRKPDTAKADLKPLLAGSGGQGVHREVESEGHEEKCYAGPNNHGLKGVARGVISPQLFVSAKVRPSHFGVYTGEFGPWRSLASALAWGARGPGFKSRRPDQLNHCPFRIHR